MLGVSWGVLLSVFSGCIARPTDHSHHRSLVRRAFQHGSIILDESKTRHSKGLVSSGDHHLDGCPLPLEDISTASWCQLRTNGNLASIATYGLGSKDFISQTVCKTHVWENHRSAEDLGLPRDLRSADGGPPIVLDVGGNMGVTMMMFAKSGYRVTAVEAMSQNRKLLNATLCANPDIRNLVSVEAAIVGTPEQAGSTCKVCIDFGSDATVLCPGDARGPECDSWEPEKHKKTKEELKVKTLDQIIAEHRLPHVDVMKMDIEGYECQAMKGAQHLLKELRPRFIMSELQNNPPGGALVGCTPAEFIHMFRDARYDVFTDRFGGTPLVGDPQIEKYMYPNFFFVRRD